MPLDMQSYFHRSAPGSPSPKVFRDPVHGADIVLAPFEVAIVNTAEFQRLRGIKQLGPCELVWHGATHTRFQHSLGTLHVAQCIVNHLHGESPDRGAEFLPPERQIVVRLFALLHDLGHIPFGHTIEDERPAIGERHSDRKRVLSFIDGEISALLSALEAEMSPKQLRSSGVGATIKRGNEETKVNSLTDLIVNLITECKGETDEDEPEVPTNLQLYLDIVGNTVCADLLDYLRRDTYHTGLRRDYDDRIITDLRLTSEGRVALDVLGSSSSRTELANLIGVRFSLTERVYFNHTKIWAAAMISKAIDLAAFPLSFYVSLRDEELLGFLEIASRLKMGHDSEVMSVINGPVDRPVVDIDKVLQAGEGSIGQNESMLLTDAWQLMKDSTAGRDLVGAAALTREYRRRNVFRPVYLATDRLGTPRSRFLNGFFHSHERQHFRLAVEAFIARMAGVLPWQIVISCPSPKMNRKYADPLVGPLEGGENRYEQLEEIRVRGDHDPRLKNLLAVATFASDSHPDLWRFDVIVPESLALNTKSKIHGLCSEMFGPSESIEGERFDMVGVGQIRFEHAEAALKQLNLGTTVDEVRALATQSFKESRAYFIEDFVRDLKPTGKLFDEQ